MSFIETPSRVHLRSAESVAPNARHPGNRILLIDASNDDRIAEALRVTGYDIVGRSANPWASMTLVGSLRPDAATIVVDAIDTRTVVLIARRIREHHPIVVLLLCADDHPRTMAQLKSVGAHGIVELPTNPAKLDAAIQAALSARTSRPRVVQMPQRGEVSVEARRVDDVPQLIDRFKITSARAARTGLKFAVGLVDIRCADAGGGPSRIDLGANARERLKRLLRETDVVMTQADGKLAFLVEDVDAATVDAVGGRITRVLSEPMRTGNDSVRPLPMVGIAVWQSPNDDAHRLLAIAEGALREKARDGGKGWRVASSSAGDITARPSKSPQRRDVKWSVVLQRTVGWISLITLGWVVANYSEIMRAKNLLIDPQQIVAQFHYLLGQAERFVNLLAPFA